MWKLPAIVFTAVFLLILTQTARAETRTFIFTDQSGRPIPSVTVYFTMRVMPPAPFVESGAFRADAQGKVTITHPCGPSSGSCCLLTSSLSLTFGKPGYTFSPATGMVSCGGFNPPAETRVSGAGMEVPVLAAVSAASYLTRFAPEMIAASFGENLAASTEAARLPLPTVLAGRSLLLRDAQSKDWNALLLFVSPAQINFIAPAGMAQGPAIAFLRDERDTTLRVGFLDVGHIAPGVFTANANGQGVPAAIVTRVRPGNAQSFEPVAEFDQIQGKFVPVPIDLGVESDIVVLSLFGTGWRRLSPPNNAVVRIGGIDCPIEYVGKQPTLEGLDQINVRLPRTLIGKGDADVEVRIESATADIVQLKFK